MKGKQIQTLREKLGLTVVEFATLLGVQTSSVYRWENSGNKAASVEGTAGKVMQLIGDMKVKERATVIKHLRRGGWMPALHSLLGMSLKKGV